VRVVEHDLQVAVHTVEVTHVELAERIPVARLDAHHEASGVEVLEVLIARLEPLDEHQAVHVCQRLAGERWGIDADLGGTPVAYPPALHVANPAPLVRVGRLLLGGAPVPRGAPIGGAPFDDHLH
jgi:hypothetical protein